MPSHSILRATAVAALFLATSLRAQPLGERLDALLGASFRSGDFNGAVLVERDGAIVYDKCFGIADPATSENLQSRYAFRLASISKGFTGMVVALLAAEGALDLDAEVRRHIEGFPYEGVTLRHLVHHTSGLPDYLELLEEHWDVERRGSDERKVATNDDGIALLIEHAPAARFRPGERWEYSNTGYMVAASVVERVTGESFGHVLKRRIFEPLGMETATLFSPVTGQRVRDRVRGFARSTDTASAGSPKLTPADYHYANGMCGDGAVFASVYDLLKWARALRDERLASRDVLRRVLEPGKLANGSPTGYGFGWLILRAADGSPRVGHEGAWVGFRTLLVTDPERRNTVIVLTNNSCARFDELKEAIVGLVDEDTAKSPPAVVSAGREGTAPPPPDAASPARDDASVAVTRRVPLSEQLDATTGRTTVSTASARFDSGGFLAVRQWMRVSYAFDGERPSTAIDTVSVHVETRRSQGLYGGKKTIDFVADGAEVSCKVADYRVDRRVRRVGQRSIVERDETLALELRVTDLERLVAAKEITFGPSKLGVSAEQRDLLAAILARVSRGPGSGQ